MTSGLGTRAEPADGEGRGSSSPRRDVLVVEDEASISGLLESYLEREGFDVDVTSDGESGVERARNHRPDVIVLT